jgi:molybdate transport system ATP-binding protein
MNENALVVLKDVTVTRGAIRLLDRVSWRLVPGENWALTGPNGSGKSSFIRVVRGDLWPDQDGVSERRYRMDEPSGRRWLISPIGFREHTGLVSPELQDTYLRLEIDLPALSIILAGFHDTLRPLAAPTFNQLERARAMLDIVGAAELSDRSFLTLSRGEGRKILLARALAPGPSILFLDEPFAGLDKLSRRELSALLDSLARKGQQYLLATHRPSEIPATADRLARMEGGRLIPMGKGDAPEVQPGTSPPLESHDIKGGNVQTGDCLIEIENGWVFYQGIPALQAITWSLCRSEHWAVVGPNGSGKSSLLKLILGLIPPALGGTVRRNLSVPTHDVRDVRRAVGWVSSELQAAIDTRLTAEEAVLTGMYGGDRLPASPPVEDRRRSRETLSSLGLSPLAHRKIAGLSYGQLRQVLLARALVGRPELLLLDEPLSGLDPAARKQWIDLLATLAAQGCTLVVTSHYPEDIPPVVTHVMKLEKGRIVKKGGRNGQKETGHGGGAMG